VSSSIDWFGCATFRLTIGGLVVFLDAYIDRVQGASGSGATADDIDAADFILIGHSHFDHLWGAERIAKRTKATIVGSYETIRIMQAQGVPMSQLLPVAGGERIRLDPTTTVSVFPSLHSCVWSHTKIQPSDAVCIGDLGLTYQERILRLGELQKWMQTLSDDVRRHSAQANQGALGDGGALIYLLETPAGSLLYQDTAGQWSGILQDLRPDVAILAAAGRGNLDGEPTQGTLAEFVGEQAARLKPSRVLLSHHDDWLPGFSISIDVAPIREVISRRSPRTSLVEVDYVSGYRLFEGLP